MQDLIDPEESVLADQIAKIFSDAIQSERDGIQSIVESIEFALESDENPFEQSLTKSEHP